MIALRATPFSYIQEIIMGLVKEVMNGPSGASSTSTTSTSPLRKPQLLTYCNARSSTTTVMKLIST